MKTFCYTFAVVTGSFLLVSCQSMRTTEPASDLSSGDVPSSFAPAEAVVAMPDAWWTAFGSKELDGLMDKAFSSNLSLAQAWTQLRQARAAATSAAADGKVQIAATGDASQAHTHGDGGATTQSYSAGLTVSYEVDLWGRIASTTDAARLAAEASEQDVRATAMSLSGEIATAWVSVKSYQAQIALVERQLRASNEYLELLKVRQRKGISELVDVLQQRQDVAGLESTAESLRESLAIARLELAYLLGMPDDSGLSLESGGLPELPALPAPGVPAELLSRRPDIAAARLRLRAQEKTVAAAKAARLPSLSLTGSATLKSDQLNRLMDNWVRSLAAGLSAPLLDGSRLAAEEASARALRDQRLLAYRDTVLAAILEVNEALTRETWRQAYVGRLQTEATYAQETFAETQQRYLKGKDDYLAVLTALSGKQTAERNLVTAKANLLSNRVALCAALGGGWLNTLSENN